jgi:MinD-like ATPase involved in chromosome partitioning or flagellar assembly
MSDRPEAPREDRSRLRQEDYSNDTSPSAGQQRPAWTDAIADHEYPARPDAVAEPERGQSASPASPESASAESPGPVPYRTQHGHEEGASTAEWVPQEIPPRPSMAAAGTDHRTAPVTRPDVPSADAATAAAQFVRPPAAFREDPARYGPQGAPRETRQMPPAAQPHGGSAGQRPGWMPSSQQPGAPAQRQSGSYGETLDLRSLAPSRPAPPTGGWRRALYEMTFGLVNPGPSLEDRREMELEKKIRTSLRGRYRIGVMGKGGVGKTTVSASVGTIFAELRPEDRVVAVDADTAFGKLASRIDPKASGSYWELAGDRHLDSFADIRNRLGNNAAGLYVLAGENTPAHRRVLDAAIYREATAQLDRHFSISIVDCSATVDSPVTQEVLGDLDSLIVVSSPWIDGAAAAGQTLDWLAAHGMTDLLHRTIVVLNDSDGHADKRTRSILSQQFSSHGQPVIEVPFDGGLRPGGIIDSTNAMSRKIKRPFVEIAAVLAEHFPSRDDRARPR